MDYIKKAKTLSKAKNYRTVTKYIEGNKLDFYTYIISDYKQFKSDNSFFMRGFCVINDSIISRGLPKFFNINENEDWLLNEDTGPIQVFEKFDGTLIIPFIIDNKIFFRTKMDIDNQFTKLALECLTPELEQLIREKLDQNLTPMFELISPLNQIVVKYEETSLRYICDVDENMQIIPRSKPKEFQNICEVNKYLEDIDNFEGFVFYYRNRVYKIKSPKYVAKHRAVSNILNCYNVFELILEEQIDDIKSFIDNKEILNFISKIEQELILKIDKSINKILNADYSLDRKSFALKYKPTTEGFIFGVMMKKYSGLCEDVVTELKKSMLKTFTTESKVKNFLGL